MIILCNIKKQCERIKHNKVMIDGVYHYEYYSDLENYFNCNSHNHCTSKCQPYLELQCKRLLS